MCPDKRVHFPQLPLWLNVAIWTLSKSILKMRGKPFFSSLVLIPDAWNADLMAGVLSATLGHEEPLSMEAMRARTES